MAPLERRLGARYVHQATQRLARVQPDIVAITGSYGKTSTKGYLAHLLEGRRVVLASPRSYNNQAGLARTVNEHLVSGTDLLIAEMGTYGQGEIRAMCAWMTPSVAVITAIGPVHLERFRRLDITLAAKAEITERASSVVLNGEDPLLLTLVTPLRSVGKRVIVCSLTDQDADLALIASEKQLDLYVAGVSAGSVDMPPQSAAIALSNVACALGAALAIGEDPAELLPLCTTLPQSPNRLVATVGERGIVILDDTFNSNPVGARHAISLLAQTGGEGHRRVLVTPGMVELGPLQFAENRQFAVEAAEICDIIVIVGRTNRRALLAGAYGHAEVRTFPNRETAVAWIRATLSEGDVVLYENDLPDHYA
jgi:UDP-N-acetylmuramoyl-tripeptide--D-alanyl-D-alanine ligase